MGEYIKRDWGTMIQSTAKLNGISDDAAQQMLDDIANEPDEFGGAPDDEDIDPALAAELDRVVDEVWGPDPQK